MAGVWRGATQKIIGRERNQRTCDRQLVRNVVDRRRVNSTVMYFSIPHSRPCLLAFALALAVASLSCERDTRITIVDAKVPPTFRLSGNGRLGTIIVAGPYATVEDLDSFTVKVGKLWEIQRGYGTLPIGDVPSITYGVLPSGFTQRVPTSGMPPPLEEGKFYGISAPSVNAGFRVLCFTVDKATVVQAPCRER